MKHLINFIKRPIPLWLIVPFIVVLFASPLIAGPPIWYGGLNLNGGTIQDPAVSSASCVITDNTGVYKYQTCPPTPYPTPTGAPTAAPIVVPTPATWAGGTTGTTNTQKASITTTSGTSGGPIGAWVLRAYASTRYLDSAAANDQQLFCLYANVAPTNAANYSAGTCGAVATYVLYADMTVFSGTAELQIPASLVWQGQYANNTTVTIRTYSVNNVSASGAIGEGALMLEWIPI